MGTSTTRKIGTAAVRGRVLVVADWAIDPNGVVQACMRRMDDGPSHFALLVPAWLHGLDWAGDPKASAPCARRQLASIQLLAGARGVGYTVAGVGDPDVVTAIGDALAASPADEVLLCSRTSLLGSHPFNVAHRARRATGLPVRRIEVPVAGAPHCSPREVGSPRAAAVSG
jgi:hypothetical protein